MQATTAQVGRRQKLHQSTPVPQDIIVLLEVLIRCLVRAENTKMSSNRDHARPAPKGFTVMQQFSMQHTVATACNSQAHVSKVITA